jgi:hypothetical protein
VRNRLTLGLIEVAHARRRSFELRIEVANATPRQSRFDAADNRNLLGNHGSHAPVALWASSNASVGIAASANRKG